MRRVPCQEIHGRAGQQQQPDRKQRRLSAARRRPRPRARPGQTAGRCNRLLPGLPPEHQAEEQEGYQEAAREARAAVAATAARPRHRRRDQQEVKTIAGEVSRARRAASLRTACPGHVLRGSSSAIPIARCMASTARSIWTLAAQPRRARVQREVPEEVRGQDGRREPVVHVAVAPSAPGPSGDPNSSKFRKYWGAFKARAQRPITRPCSSFLDTGRSRPTERSTSTNGSARMFAVPLGQERQAKARPGAEHREGPRVRPRSRGARWSGTRARGRPHSRSVWSRPA